MKTIALLVLAGCASLGGPLADRGTCPELLVKNDHWLGASVKLESPLRRLGTIEGLTTRTFKWCYPKDAQAALVIHMLGDDTFTLSSRSYGVFEDGGKYAAYISPTLRGSWLR